MTWMLSKGGKRELLDLRDFHCVQKGPLVYHQESCRVVKGLMREMLDK